jgi:polar amino acid transport system substrate-binding protein
VQPSSYFLKYAKRVRGLAFAGAPFAEGFYGIAVRKDNAKLADRLNEALENLLQKGELKRILEKWDLWNVQQYWVYSNKDQKIAKEDQAEGPSAPEFWSFTRFLLAGSWQTVKITYKSMLLAIVLALPIALSRLYGPAPLRWLAGVYVEFFRGIPVLFLLYFLYYGLPHFHTSLAELGAESIAVLAFGLNYAAYEAEVYRAGIGAVPVGQWEAAASLGMTPTQTFWRIVLPQSVKGILPPMTNDLVSLFKDTSLVAAITIADLNANYRDLYRDNNGYLPIALTTAALYLIMSVPLGFLSRYLEKRWGTH